MSYLNVKKRQILACKSITAKLENFSKYEISLKFSNKASEPASQRVPALTKKNMKMASWPKTCSTLAQ